MKKEVIRYGLVSEGRIVAILKDMKSLKILAKELNLKHGYDVMKIIE